MSVCKYCGKKLIDSQEDYCSKECEIEAKKYLKKVNKYKLPFLIGTFVPALSMPFFNKPIYIIMATIVIGLVILLFPFPTPETIGIFGIRKSQKVARYLGGFVIIFAIVGGFFTYI